MRTLRGAKLAEFATAKQVAMPKDPHRKTARLLKDLNGKQGAAFDRVYLDESGVAGHQMRRDTMMKVQAEATDPALKAWQPPRCR